MRYSNNFAASSAVLLLTTSLTAALPLSQSSSSLTGGTFSVGQVSNPYHVRNGALAYTKALRKYGAPIPDNLRAAAIRAANATGLNLRLRQEEGSDTATPEGANDAEYLSPVSIGTPAQQLNLDFDTGSADLWVFSTETPANEVNGQALYAPGASSSSSQLSGETWRISYGDGSGASGNVFADTVAVGGVTVTRQAVEAATSVSSSFSGDSASSGLLGLAFSSINTVAPTKARTFFANAQDQLQSPLFTSQLRYHAPGVYNFGYIDTSAYSGNIAYTPVNAANGFWQFTGSGYAVGTGAFTESSINAVADTGTSLLLAPDDAVSAYYAQVSGAQNSQFAGGYTFPCSTTLPSFTFGAGEYRGVIPGQYLNYAPFEGGMCFGGIQSSAGIGMSIYGDVLLKSQFVVWDGGNTRLGFAQQSDVPATTTDGSGGSSGGDSGGFGGIFGGWF